MATEIQLRRGTTAQNAAFTGVEGEVTYDTQAKRLITHDGTTAGGELQAKKSEVDAKQNTLGFTPENVANKSTDGTLAANSLTLYPSQSAVKTYADTKQTALGFTPENVANKSTDGTMAANSLTLYPSQSAVVTYVATAVGPYVLKAGDTMTGTLTISRQSADNIANGLDFSKRGTVGDANAAVVLGVILGLTTYRGWDTATLASGGSIRFATTENWTPTAHGTQILFQVTTACTATPATAMTLNPYGLTIPGSLALGYRATAVTTTFLATDHTVDCTSGTFTLNLPTAVGITGRLYVAKNSGAGIVTLDADGGELIDGVATQTINPGASLTVQSTNAGWIII